LRAKFGSCIIAAGYLVISVSAALGMIFIHNHPHEIHLHQAQIATPWALVNQLLAGLLAATLGFTALREAKSAKWTLALLTVTTITWLAVRVSMDPTCLGALHEHGCHTFLAGILIAMLGCVICAVEMARGR
jgi:hypothetical protein